MLVFTTTDCPISNRYAPEIQRLAAKFGERATFVLVYPVRRRFAGPDSRASQEVRLRARVDPRHRAELVKQTGVTVTPEVAVMAGDRMVYRGRIDDRYVELGRDRPKPTRARSRGRARLRVVAGKPVAHARNARGRLHSCRI